ncbi:MAG: hypothetical protein HY660_01705 [Armatimonadetes bacterium]|nr:hypothetical protein [Armatimonadota bacterium]
MRIEGVTGQLPATEPARSYVQGSASFEDILTKIEDAPQQAAASVPLKPAVPVQTASPVASVAPVAPASFQSAAASAVRTAQGAGVAQAAPRPWGPLALVQQFFGWIGNLITGAVSGVRNGLAALFRGRPNAPATAVTNGATATTTTASTATAASPAATPANGTAPATAPTTAGGTGGTATPRPIPVAATLMDQPVDSGGRNPWR